MKLIKITSCIVVALIMCAVFVCGCAKTEKVETGVCGEETTWTLSDGVLTVEGTGAVETPVKPAGKVETVVVNEGVTEIGGEAFKDIPGVQSIDLPDSLFRIGKEAFAGLTDIEEIEIPDSVKEIAGDAFRGWQDSQKIISEWYEGSVEDWQSYFDLWGSYFGELKAFMEDPVLSEKMQNFMNKWTGYIEEHANEFIETFGNVIGSEEEDLFLVIAEAISGFEDEFINDILEIVPYVEEVLGKLENEGKGIIYEIQGDLGRNLKNFYFSMNDLNLEELLGGEDVDEAISAISELLPQYERGIKAFFGGVEEDPEGASEAAEGQNSWIIFWDGIDEDVLEKIFNGVEKGVYDIR